MARFKPSGKPVKPVVPTKSKRQTSRLHGEPFGSGCDEHGGKDHVCARTWRHAPPCECGCGEEAT